MKPGLELRRSRSGLERLSGDSAVAVVRVHGVGPEGQGARYCGRAWPDWPRGGGGPGLEGLPLPNFDAAHADTRLPRTVLRPADYRPDHPANEDELQLAKRREVEGQAAAKR